MKEKSESRITAEAIFSAINNGAKSLTAVAKALGYKSGSSGVIQAILKVVPDLREHLHTLNDLPSGVANERGEKNEKNKPASPSAYPIPDCVPYRPSCGYAMVWSILYAHRQTGISRKDLIEKYKTCSGKPEPNCGYDVQVVCSVKEKSTCNRSALRASQFYWVERANDLLKLHLVEGTRKPQ